MRVIKEGKPPQDRLMRGTCRMCACVIECNVSECIPRGYYSFVYVCPTCKGDIELSPHDTDMESMREQITTQQAEQSEAGRAFIEFMRHRRNY